MKLILEIEFLTGVCRAARGPGSDRPDWPPQPDRVFSALVSAWGVRGEAPHERTALEWLEKQAPPQIQASGYSTRTTPDVYVPPNDSKASTIHILPDCRPRQPRRFPVARPDDPTMKLIWPNAPEASMVATLNTLTHHVGYIGHSASLARCRFLVRDVSVAEQKLKLSSRRVYPGRLCELEEAYRTRPDRPVIRSAISVISHNIPLEPKQISEWLVLEAIRGKIPDIRASALICRRLRQTLMAGYQRTGQGSAIPEVVSGHTPTGQPTKKPHVAVVPMAFVGWPHADGRILGLAVIPPQGLSLHRIDGFHAAWRDIAHYHENEQRRVLRLQGSPLRSPLDLSPADTTDKNGKPSLLPDLYLQRSYRWASVTPIVLERHLKRRDDAEIRELVVQACANAGLPRPNPERIWVGKHSAVNGVPAARPRASEPPWTKWRLPKLLETRRLTHAVIDFEQPVSGPVLLGAGRFIGLGLFRSVRN